MNHEPNEPRRAGPARPSPDPLPPHAPEAEAALLGCLLLDPARLAECGELFGAEPVWFEWRHRVVWETMLVMRTRGEAVDTVTLYTRLRDAGRLDEAGGAGYLTGLPDRTPTSFNWKTYADQVWEKFVARRAIQMQVAAAADIQEHGGLTEELRGRLLRQGEEIQKFSERGSITPRYLRRPGEFLDEIEARLFGADGTELPGLELPIKFPLKIRRKETTLVTGDDGAGKSTVLFYFLLHLAAQGEKVCIGSFEMPRDVTMWVLASMLLGRKRLEDSSADRARGAAAVAWLHAHFYIYDFLGIADYREVLDTFRYAARHLGVTQFLVDSVMRIGLADDDYAAQGFCAAAFANFAMQENAHLWHVIHENKGDNKGKARIRGSKLWSANACNVLRIERNMKKAEEAGNLEWKLALEKRKDHPDAAEVASLEAEWKQKLTDHDTTMHLQKQRWPGSHQNGVKRFWFDPMCFQFRGHWEDAAVNWLERWGKKANRQDTKTPSGEGEEP